MRILLTNDDGIHAEGLVSLERIARAISDDIWICAPEYEQSGASRSLTLAEPLRVRRLDDRRFATTGTPTDCVLMACYELMPDQPVFEPAEHFGPGIVRRLVEIGWPSDVVMNVNFPSRALDQIREVEVTRQTFRDLHVRQAVQRTDPRGEIYYWMGFRRELSAPAAGTDLRAIYDGRISVTPLHIDLTHQETVHRMRAVLGGAPPKA